MQVQAGQLRMSVTQSEREVIIILDGELDTRGRLRFRQQIHELLGRGGTDVVVDVGGLSAIDIAGMAALLRADLLLRGVHSTVRIRGASPAFMALLRSTGLTGRLHVEPGSRRPATGTPRATATSSAR
ncbi:MULTISPECIES: STAS domain-containing protein [Protofrankia]|uniref:Sulfate transporter/antisigma-factor antagonist STAS n=1 Tax=Candidatus Protofrankia datiscae TaxID=2716812 RepID=F8B031_9ACTN|nr:MULTISPECIES: STAS domain-containing protein [Protofrankia]AEH11728.1 Sulfate transporter/antisigma-factor antagonist STAS [Candidatus Protofrankia datiscae]